MNERTDFEWFVFNIVDNHNSNLEIKEEKIKYFSNISLT
jgi:hypothetical protein